MEGVLNAISPYNCVYNPAYNKVNAQMISQLQNRGIMTQVWTLGNISQIDTYRLYGCASVTVDGISAIADEIKSVYNDKTEYVAIVGKELFALLYGEVYARYLQMYIESILSFFWI